MELDVYVNKNNTVIWDKEWAEMLLGAFGGKQIDPKKWRLDNFDRAHNRLNEMNIEFNAKAFGITTEEYKRRGLK